GCRRQKFLRIGEHEPFAVLAMRGDKDQAPVTGPGGQRGDAAEQLLRRSGLGGKLGARRAGAEAMDVAGENAAAGEPRAEGRDRIVEDRLGAVAGCQHSLPMPTRGDRALPCRGGIPPLSREAAEEYHRQAPEWGLLDEAARIERTYRFTNFAEAFSFVERAAALAEAEGHHPDICFGWGYATVSLRTKKIKGLHENDFIMAAKLDRIANTVEAG